MNGIEFQKLTGYVAHPAAALFPMITGKRFDELVESVREKGLREPIVRIVVDGETLILDGRNRLVACKAAGVDPVFVDFEGDEGEAFDAVRDWNLCRRDLTPQERMVIAEEFATLRRGRPSVNGSREPFTSIADVAQQFDVSPASVKRVRQVRNASPSLHDVQAPEPVKAKTPATVIDADNEDEDEGGVEGELITPGPKWKPGDSFDPDDASEYVYDRIYEVMMIQCPPDGALLNALCNQSMTWRTALCELIDNSIDAGATVVTVSFDGDKIRVTDDGRGKEDLTAFVRLGRHERSKSTQSGIYGVGSKDATLWIGGIDSFLTVTSVCGGKERTMSVRPVCPRRNPPDNRFEFVDMGADDKIGVFQNNGIVTLNIGCPFIASTKRDSNVAALAMAAASLIATDAAVRGEDSTLRLSLRNPVESDEACERGAKVAAAILAPSSTIDGSDVVRKEKAA